MYAIRIWLHGFLQCASKIFFKKFELELLQGKHTVKNILLNVYITEISLFSEYLQKCSQVHAKGTIDKCSIKIHRH